jgi:hypothetical protein
MSNVISLAERRRAPPTPPTPPQPVADMPASGAVMFGIEQSIVQALTFYAAQGFDHGARARGVLFEMSEAQAPTNPEQA